MSKKRIANLLYKGSGEQGYDVPTSAIEEGYSSELVETLLPPIFLTQTDRALMDLAFLEAGLRAQDEGFDAVCINTVGDYGLRLLREVAEIPVVGAGQAAMQLTAGLGERFAILTVWPPALRLTYERQLAEYGLRDRCMAIRHVTQDTELPALIAEGGVVDEMRAGHEDVVERIALEGERLVAEGAEAIMLGCGCMSPIHETMASRLGVPVVDPMTAAHKQAEALLALNLRYVRPATPPASVEYIRHMVRATAQAAPERIADPCGDTCSIIGAVKATQPAMVTAS